MHIRTDAVGVVGHTKTTIKMTMAAGYINPLSSLEETKSQIKNRRQSAKKTDRMADRFVYILREFPLP
jgi:hypothetical protein